MSFSWICSTVFEGSHRNVWWRSQNNVCLWSLACSGKEIDFCALLNSREASGGIPEVPEWWQHPTWQEWCKGKERGPAEAALREMPQWRRNLVQRTHDITQHITELQFLHRKPSGFRVRWKTKAHSSQPEWLHLRLISRNKKKFNRNID